MKKHNPGKVQALRNLAVICCRDRLYFPLDAYYLAVDYLEDCFWGRDAVKEFPRRRWDLDWDKILGRRLNGNR